MRGFAKIETIYAVVAQSVARAVRKAVPMGNIGHVMPTAFRLTERRAFGGKRTGE